MFGDLKLWGDAKNNIEWRFLLPLATFVLAVLFIFYFDLTAQVNESLRRILVEPPLHWPLFIIPVIISIFYYHADTPGAEESEVVLLTGLDEFLDIVLGGVTFGYALSASYLFLSRLFLQTQFNETFFVGFSTDRLYIIAALMGYAGYWGIKNTYRMFKDTIFSGEVGTVIPEDESNSDLPIEEPQEELSQDAESDEAQAEEGE